MTIDDGIKGNGTWEDLPIKNDSAGSAKVRTALFGSGAQNAKQMIQNIWLGEPGANTYQGMHAVLDNLDINSAHGVTHDANIATHKTHFHVAIRPPELVGLAKNIEAEQSDSLINKEQPVSLLLPATVITELRNDFGFDEEMNMLIPDMPVYSNQQAPVMVVDARAVSGEVSRNNVTAGVCFPTPNVQGMRITLEHSLSPIPSAMNYLWEFDPIFKKMGKKKGGEMLAALEKAAKVSVVTQPAIGKLTNTVPDFTDPNDGLIFYNPKPGVMSKDRVVFLVEAGDYKIKLIYSIYPTDGATGPETEKKFCGKTGVIYRIGAGAPDMTSSMLVTNATSMLEHLGGNINNLMLDVAKLNASEIASTTRLGAQSTITLDTNAAGYGWFVDTTPGDNSEFLPTSNPNEWVAKAGSEAAGKMDMLTVLLHEYGHALGLDHSADAHDFMATTLQPGVRRTLTVDQQAALMRLTGYFPVPDSPSEPYYPNDPLAPLPASRVVNTRTQARMRRPRPGEAGVGASGLNSIACRSPGA